MQPYLIEENNEFSTRKTIVIDKNSYINTIFYCSKFLNYLYQILGFRVKPSVNLPIEFRMYEKGGKMYWHRDNVVTVI